jgi:LacI family transcriptional regulator
MPDDRDAAMQLGRYLIGQGHKHIAYVSTHPHLRHFSYFHRHVGLQQAVKEAKLKSEVTTFKGPVGTWIDRVLTELSQVTALVCYNDLDTLPILSALWQRGVKVPEQISVATFNDTPITANTIPPLTTMRIPMEQMAHKAAYALLSELGQSIDEDELQALPMLASELILRSSTAPPQKRR